MLTAVIFLRSGLRGVRRGMSKDWDRCARQKMIKSRSRACNAVIQRQPDAEMWSAKKSEVALASVVNTLAIVDLDGRGALRGRKTLIELN